MGPPSGYVAPAPPAPSDYLSLSFGARRRSKARRDSFGKFSLSQLSKLSKSAKLPSTADMKKLKAKFDKHSSTLGKHLDVLTEVMSFGKKRRSIPYKKSARKSCRSKGASKKLPAKIRKLCRKLKIKTTKKVGSRRICKKLSVIKKQIARKLRKIKKAVRKVHRRR
jgi:hypothetical protein